ncbi:VWA domain-containing protein [Gammaproteobacteria bacterium]|nr:VWA domain-containing protein [Gammaproteobacteria bacterium]
MSRFSFFSPTAARVVRSLGLASLLALSSVASAQSFSTSVRGFGLKVFRVDSFLYPFVQAYFRTFDQDLLPLRNLNELNLGMMIKGRVYDPSKSQYLIQTVGDRDEAVRVAFVIDSSKTMAGAPFEGALRAIAGFVSAKRQQDQVALLKTSDSNDGYEVVSNFERDGESLIRRLADVQADGQRTRLYDTVGAAMQLCGGSTQGQTFNPKWDKGVDSIASCTIVVLSDGFDEGSALERSDLMNRISLLPVPIPIFSLAYSQSNPDALLNLQALSKNSFGKFYDNTDSASRVGATLDEILDVLLSDFVVTFRAYVPVDGEQHALKVGVEWPSRSGKFIFDSSYFEAIQLPTERLPALEDVRRQIAQRLAYESEGPYYGSAAAAVSQ